MKQTLLNATQGGKQIFIDFLGYNEEQFNTKKMFKDREESQPSAHFHKDGDTYCLKDFGTDESQKDAIAMYAEMQHCDYKEALKQLAEHYGIEEHKHLRRQPNVSKSNQITDECLKLGFEISSKMHFTQRELRFLGPHVTEEICRALHYTSVSILRIKNEDNTMTEITSDDYNMIFCHECRMPDRNTDNPSVYKIYQPRSDRFKFSYHPSGMTPGKIVNGLFELKEAYDSLNAKNREEWQNDPNKKSKTYIEQKLRHAVICSGERDALCVKAYGSNPIWLNSETAILTRQVINQIKQYAETVYYMPDCDETGLNMGYKNAYQHIDLYTIWLPKEELDAHQGDQQKTMKDFRDWCELHRDKDDFRKLMNNARPLKFWEKKKGKIIISTDHLTYFLSMHGFCCMKDPYNNELGYYHILNYENNKNSYIVEEVTTGDIRRFINDWIEKKALEQEEKDAIKNAKNISEQSIADIPLRELNFTNCSKTSQDFYCKNAVYRVTADGIEDITHSDKINYVLSSKVINHTVTLTPPMFTYGQENSEASKQKFDITLTDEWWHSKLATLTFRQSDLHWQEKEKDIELTEEQKDEDQQCLNNKLFTDGYIFHRYKDRSRPWLPIFLDWKVGKDAKEKNGRNGKSIIQQIMELFNYNITTIQLKTAKKIEYNHLFGSVTRNTDVVYIDEIPSHFDLSALNNETTNGINVNRKSHDEYFINFNESPKIICISNFVPTDTSQSQMGRNLFNVTSDYYHIKTEDNGYEDTRQPEQEFNGNLWDEYYKEEDYNRDINFIMQCTQYYLYVNSTKSQKIDPPMSNIIQRINQSNADEEVIEWLETYLIIQGNANKEISKAQLALDYNTYFGRKETESTVKKIVKTACNATTCFIFNPEDKVTDKKNHRIKRNNKEFIYIRYKE